MPCWNGYQGNLPGESIVSNNLVLVCLICARRRKIVMPGAPLLN